MARQLLIQLQNGRPQIEDRIAWIWLENGQVLSDVTQGTLAEAAAIAANAKVTISIPAESVYVTRQHLPGKNRQRLLKAVPFALEDQLINDVDDMHFALGLGDKNDQYWIAAIARDQMEHLQTLFASVGLNPQALIPDSMLLASAENELHLLCESNRSLLALPNEERLSVDNDNLAFVLKKLMLNTDLQINKIECYAADRSIDLDALVAAPVNCEVNAHITQPLILMAQALGDKLPLNLLQGEYNRRERRKHRFQTWYPAAAMLLVWIVAKLIIAGIDNIQLSGQLADIRTQQQQVYKQAFPSSKSSGDVYRKMEARLKELKQRRGDAEASFYHILNVLAPTLSASQGLLLQSMRYHDGRVDLELHLPSLQSLDQLKAALTRQSQWQVDIQSATSAKNHVEARLQIRGGA